MIKKVIIFNILFFTNFLCGFSQNDNVPIDSIINRFLKDDMIVINGWALLGPESFFDSLKIDSNYYQANLLSSDSAIHRYGYYGSKIRIYEVTIPTLDSISFGYFIDSKVIKYLNPEREIFYFIDGAPCWHFVNAVNLIENKRIIEIQELGVNQATAIWGQKDGEKGALVINTDKKLKNVIIFK